MAIIPTNRGGNESVRTGAVAPRISFAGPEATASRGRSLSAGLSDLAHGITNSASNIASNVKQRQEYNDHLWSESKHTEAQRKWIQWTNDVQKNGSEDVVAQFQEGYTKYQQEVLATAPNKAAADRLRLKLDDLGTQVFDGALRIEASNRSKNTINTFNAMLLDSADIIAQAPELYATQQARLSETLKISVEQNRIDKGAAEKMQNHINSLAADAADAMISRNPTRAKEIIDGAKGIDWSRRKSILNEIERAMQSNDTLFHYQQTELFKSTLTSISESGQAPDSFNVDVFVSSFPRNQQAAVKEDAIAKINIAETIFVGKSELQGKSIVGINETLNKYAPQAGSKNYANEEEAYRHIFSMADRQIKLQEADPYTYARQDPIVDGAWKIVESLPEDTTPELRSALTSQAMESSVNFQKSIGVPDGRLSVMSNGQAVGIASKINQGNVQEVQQTFSSMQQSFGKYYSNAFRDLARLPVGQRIDGAMQIVGLHMGQPFLSDFIAAIRTPDSDIKLEPGDYKLIYESINTNADFAGFSSALVSANPGAISYVDDFNRAITKYAASLLFRGKAKSPEDALQKSSDLIIKSAYAFTEVGGASVAIKRSQNGVTISDDDVPTIHNGLMQASRTVDYREIDLKHFSFPANISDEVRTQSIQDTLSNDTFWVTNSANDGAALFMHGLEDTSAPLRYKSGASVEVKFVDLITTAQKLKGTRPVFTPTGNQRVFKINLSR